MTGKTLTLALLAFTTMLASCGTTTIVGYDGPCPLRPELQPVSVELQIEVSPHTLMIFAENQLKLKKHIKDLEVLSGCTVG